MKIPYEVKVSVAKVEYPHGKYRYHVVLQHPDNTEEISYQSWPTKAECKAAIEQYAKDTGGEVRRFN